MYWAIDRSADETKINCKVVPVDRHVLSCTGKVTDADVKEEHDRVIVTVPVITNTKRIEKGSALVVMCEPGHIRHPKTKRLTLRA